MFRKKKEGIVNRLCPLLILMKQAAMLKQDAHVKRNCRLSLSDSQEGTDTLSLIYFE